jgi:ElaB/YqjD/DUF883 family membrane-anchored ribosome-binding protein
MSYETDRIEADINNTRHRLNDTLDALGSKLSPGQMVDEVLGLAQGQAGQFAAKLGRQVRDNPMPSVLIAAGVAMLFLNRDHADSADHFSGDDWHTERRFRTVEEARWRTPRMANESDADYEHRLHEAHASALNLKQRAGEAIDAFKQRVANVVSSAEDAASSVRHKMGDAVSDAAHFAKHQGERLGQRAANVSHKTVDFYGDNPVAFGAIALAIGALIGSATPLSDTERNALEGVADKAARTGADLAEKGAQLVQDRSAVH